MDHPPSRSFEAELQQLALAIRGLADEALQGHRDTVVSLSDSRLVRGIIKARRLRERFFGLIFADPAWDILLDPYIARLEKRRLSVSSLCIGAAVPATTALRWITALTKKGMLVRENDPNDGRGVVVTLSDETHELMCSYFRNVRQQMHGI